jgi:phosphomannomutase
MKIPRHVFREYDIRGVAEADLTDELARAIGQSYVAMLAAEEAGGVEGTVRVAVGRDGRSSSDRLFAALGESLLDAGAQVISVGVGPTPLLYFAAHHLGTDGAVMSTASHKQEGALLAGEMSGHLFFADRWPGFDDAIYATLRLLEILGHTQKTVGELLADVPETFATPEIRVACPDDLKRDVVERIRQRYRPTRQVVDVDGARVDFGGGAWGLCRASNTQPALVLRCEARSEARLREVRGEMERAVADAIRSRLGEPSS